MTRGNHPSPERQAILKAIQLNEQLHGVGLSVRAAALAAGVDVDTTRTAIHNMMHVGKLKRLDDHSSPRCVVYGATAHAAATATQGDGPDHPRNMRNTAHYTGAELRPYTGRPGALDAYKLPSLIDGQRVDRRPPTIMSASPAQARTGHWV